ncbi:MAG: M48 family metalloprotease [Pseudomonadota bacterium]
MHYRRLIIQNMLALLLFQSAPLLAQSTDLPDLGAPDLIEYDQQTEEKLGRAFTTLLHTDYSLNYDPEVVSFVRKIGHKIASQTGNHRNFRFYVIDNDSINAFAGPDGVIGIHTGLIKAVQSEDELASVIAHEIAHVTQRHLSRRYEYQTNQGSIASVATVLAAILIGMHDANAGMATLMGGMGYNMEQQLKNSRLHESEADSKGIELLQKANYNPYAMGHFFARLAKAGQNNSFSLPEILRSHPVTESRIAEAENRAQTMPPLKAKEPDNSLKLIKLRLNEGNFQRDSEDLLFLKQQQSTAENCYQLNLINLKKPTNPVAMNKNRSCLWQLIKDTPEQILYTNLLIESISQSQDRELLNRLLKYTEYQQALHPNDTSGLLRYADLLIKLDRVELGTRTLESRSENQKYKYQSNQKLAEIYAQQQKKAEAYYFQAVAQLDIGNTKRSEYLLKKAQENLKSTDVILKNKIFLFSNKHANLLKNSSKNQ